MRKTVSFLLTAAVLMATLALGATAGVAQEEPLSGFRALRGEAAADFDLPGDVELVTRFELSAYGLTYERYQQIFGEAEADVLGGQLTLLLRAGVAQNAIGAHYPAIDPTNSVNLTAADARQKAAGDVGRGGERIVTLMIQPEAGRYFYRVETRRADERWIHWIDAGDGAIFNRFNAIMHSCDGAAAPCGFGVQYTEDSGDVKDLSGLTTPNGSEYLLLASDGRQETHDQGSTNRPFLGPVASDADDSWVLLGDESPAQQALVDAQYYANVTDDYFLAVHGYDWVAEATAAGANDRMEIHAHYTKDYNNAFWNGEYIALGDGDQSTFEELTAMDVVGHELTHGVTDFTSDLIYEDESGALNESFSDILGSSMEYWAESGGLEPATTLEPDWLIGEDFDLRGDTVPGFRNMADPTEDDDPSHYDDRYTGGDDNGGVHTNSGISNHWFYLLVNGGQNADPNRASGTDVAGIGLEAAEDIAFLGFTALPADATFCEARASTIAVVGSYDANVTDAWDEVGVENALCGGATEPTATPTATETPTPTPTPNGEATPTPTPTNTPEPTATPTPSSAGMHVGDLDGQSTKLARGAWSASVTVTVHDGSHGSVENATVAGTFYQGGSAVVSAECTTDASGTCSVDSGEFPSNQGRASFEVDSVSHESLSYSPADNHDPDGDSDGTIIELTK